MSYEFHTKPFEHQAKIFAETSELEDYALFWEQGCGKTKPTIDTVSKLFLEDKIDALVVVAPNGVHRNWVTDEIPVHMPPAVREKSLVEYWQTSKAGNKGFQIAMNRLAKFEGLAILTLSYDAFVTKKALDFLRAFFRKRRVMMVIDEAHSIKNPAAVRTKTIRKAGAFTSYRRVLTGTPITKPFDIYAQIDFLDPTFWPSHGYSNFSAFKRYFGVWRTCNLGGGRSFQQLVEYRNLDELTKLIAMKGHRLTKEDALDLPPKIYSKRWFDLDDEARDVYDNLRIKCMAQLGEEVVTAQLAIVLLLRLQQVTSGYVPLEDGRVVRLKQTPRLDAFSEYSENIERQAIVWARFTDDIDQICNRLEDVHGPGCYVRYDGSVSEDDRARNKALFQGGHRQWFVGNPQAGATGLTLVGAKHVAYYSNSFRLVDRLQSEDRAHRIGQSDSVDYTDFMAVNTVDSHIVRSLREGFDIAGGLLGDKLREWI